MGTSWWEEGGGITGHKDALSQEIQHSRKGKYFLVHKKLHKEHRAEKGNQAQRVGA